MYRSRNSDFHSSRKSKVILYENRLDKREQQKRSHTGGSRLESQVNVANCLSERVYNSLEIAFMAFVCTARFHLSIYRYR